MIPSRWFGHASLDLSVLTSKPRIANEFLLLCLKLTCGHCRTTCIGPNLALLSRADEEIGWESQLAISFITLVYLGDKFSKSAQGYFRFFLTYFELNSLIKYWWDQKKRFFAGLGCHNKFWIDSEQKSWILKMFRAHSSAGNPGCHWIIGLKIKSYYQTLPFWWKLNQEKALLFSKNWEFI